MQTVEFMTDDSLHAFGVDIPDDVHVRTTFSTTGREVILFGNNEGSLDQAIAILRAFIETHGGVQRIDEIVANTDPNLKEFAFQAKLIPIALIALAFDEAA